MIKSYVNHWNRQRLMLYLHGIWQPGSDKCGIPAKVVFTIDGRTTANVGLHCSSQTLTCKCKRKTDKNGLGWEKGAGEVSVWFTLSRLRLRRRCAARWYCSMRKWHWASRYTSFTSSVSKDDTKMRRWVWGIEVCPIRRTITFVCSRESDHFWTQHLYSFRLINLRFHIYINH